MTEPFALAGPPEWDPTEQLIDIGGGAVMHERARVQFIWEGRLVTFHLLAGHSDDETDDQVVVEEIAVRDHRPPGVQAQSLKQLPWKLMKITAIERCKIALPQTTEPRGASPMRRAALTPHHLAVVAKIYADAATKGLETTRAVQEHGPYPCSPHTAVKWIWTARREGMLTKTNPGQRGGELTAKARRLLEEVDH